MSQQGYSRDFAREREFEQGRAEYQEQESKRQLRALNERKL